MHRVGDVQYCSESITEKQEGERDMHTPPSGFTYHKKHQQGKNTGTYAYTGGHSEDGSDLREAFLHHTPPRDVRPHPQATCSLSGLFYSWSTKSAPAHTKAILATARLGSLKLRSLTYTFLTSVVRAFTRLGSSGDGAITSSAACSQVNHGPGLRETPPERMHPTFTLGGTHPPGR